MDLIILSDIVEHVEDDYLFLERVSKCCEHALFKIPLEECITNKNLVYFLRGRKKPANMRYGPQHHNGHLRGYSVRSALNALDHHFHILDYEVSDVTSFYPGRIRNQTKRLFGGIPTIWLWGGALFAIGSSKNYQKIT